MFPLTVSLVFVIHFFDYFYFAGPHYVGRLLRCIMSLDEDCRESVIKTRERLWPRQPDETERREAEIKQKEERRRKARERQKKLMEEFASKQRQFMERQAMETGMEFLPLFLLFSIIVFALKIHLLCF